MNAIGGGESIGIRVKSNTLILNMTKPQYLHITNQKFSHLKLINLISNKSTSLLSN